MSKLPSKLISGAKLVRHSSGGLIASKGGYLSDTFIRSGWATLLLQLFGKGKK